LRLQEIPTFEFPRRKAWDVDVTEFELADGVAEFQLKSKPIARHRVTTNGAARTGSRPTPDADLMLFWEQAGANRRSGFPTQQTFCTCRDLTTVVLGHTQLCPPRHD
jgi:hypothetical protein